MSTIITRVDGHLVTTTRVEGGMWETQIDSHLPLEERYFDLRSTYASADAAIAINAAMCEILGYYERN